MGRTILVGDIHGCASELAQLLETVKYAQGADQLVLVGDLVARGPDSRGAVMLARSSGARVVRGNHDEKVLTWWRARRGGTGKRGGHSVTLSERHRAVAEALDEEHFAWLDALPLMLRLVEHGVIVVHAGVDPRAPVESQDPHVLMNIRAIDPAGVASRRLDGTPWVQLWNGPEHIVFGHDARRGLQLAANATGLDTGCCYGRGLTALVLEEGEPVPGDVATRRKRLVFVPARENYCPVGDGNGPE